MIRPFASIALFALSFTVTSAAIAQERPRPDRPIPGRQRADPGKVAATDIAFARAARDEGQWTAFRRFADGSAQMHGDDGPLDASALLLARPDPEAAMRWMPNTVWSSCDGSLAVSFGRTAEGDGTVGSYVTVWERQRGRAGDYQWIYNSAAPDNPQPAPATAAAAPVVADIVVTEIPSIEARTADCHAPANLPMDGLSAMLANAQSGGGAARDGTLRWRWEHHGPGRHRVVVDWIRDGAWAEALVFDVPDS